MRCEFDSLRRAAAAWQVELLQRAPLLLCRLCRAHPRTPPIRRPSLYLPAFHPLFACLPCLPLPLLLSFVLVAATSPSCNAMALVGWLVGVTGRLRGGKGEGRQAYAHLAARACRAARGSTEHTSETQEGVVSGSNCAQSSAQVAPGGAVDWSACRHSLRPPACPVRAHGLLALGRLPRLREITRHTHSPPTTRLRPTLIQPALFRSVPSCMQGGGEPGSFRRALPSAAAGMAGHRGQTQRRERMLPACGPSYKQHLGIKQVEGGARQPLHAGHLERCTLALLQAGEAVHGV